ncbi:hypothetical protein SAMN04515666_11925 [Bosea lupini]|uniref:Uncharacterized protein n=1 Tax=Bosea lupini TaxID=1036779 RepID=A0A1H8ADZ8_9HYPH|nr:hypothetical protein [Bosea lupini]SEM68995.1 hypothetical protein SAMN04515666_11925 [Bosea lupini]
MIPSAAIAMLDRQLAAHGSMVTLTRAGGALADLTCRAFVRDFKPDELVGSIQQGDRLAVLSPTPLTPAGWIAPKEGDRVRSNGQWFRVQAPDPIAINDVVVRVELHLRGM